MTRSWLFVVVLLTVLPRPVASQVTERLYQQACDDGDMIACNIFGLMYETGEGVRRDLARAVGLYQRACEGGALVGCTNLGLMYEAGAGVTQDSARAVGLYQVACEGGEMLGCGLAPVEQTRGAAVAERFVKSGRVGDAETGGALSEAIVEVPDLGIRVISDADGRIELGTLPAGRHSLRAERVGYGVVEGELDVPGNADFLILLNRAEVDDPLAPGRINGRIMDEGGNRGLADVDITLLGQTQVRTLSNRQGRFNLRDLQPGLAELRFTRLGYAPRTATLIVQPGSTVDLSATMFTQPIELEAIEVTVRSSYLERNGFYRRARRSWGRQFTRKDLDTIDPMFVSDLLWRVPGVTVRFGSSVQAVSRRSSGVGRGPCVLSVYVDGVPMFDSHLDWIQPEGLEAVEVYRGLNTPIEYRFFNSCGVVLLWTRRGG